MTEEKVLYRYQTHDGRSPFNEWLFSKKADPVIQARVLARLARLRVGNMGDCKALGEGLSELRLSFGPGYRIYFGQKGRQIIILLCGGDKSTQKADIRTAREYWRDFRRREHYESSEGI
jgi:putative addiction module killer protein